MYNGQNVERQTVVKYFVFLRFVFLHVRFKYSKKMYKWLIILFF